MEQLDYSVFIERYIENQMGPSERKWFGKELEGNPELVKELHLRREAETALADTEVLDLRAKLAAIQEESPVKSSNFQARKVLVLAASFLILFTTSTLLIKDFKRNDLESLYEEYFSMAQPVVKTRAVDSHSNPVYLKAISHYTDGEFEQAKSLFKQVLADEEGNMEFRFYLGISEMKLEQYDEGKVSFNKVINHGDNLFIEDAHWYLSLCYVATDEGKKALPHLEYLVEKDTPYRRKAVRLTRKIK